MNNDEADRRQIVRAHLRRTPGRVVRIGLGAERYAYGRQLTGVTVEFYDRISGPTETIDLLELVQDAVIFRIWVMDSAFRLRSGWKPLDVVTLTQDELTQVHRYARQDPGMPRRISIYECNPASPDRERPATFKDCEGLETAAVWSPHHAEDRLRDHFNGQPNIWAQSLILKQP